LAHASIIAMIFSVQHGLRTLLSKPVPGRSQFFSAVLCLMAAFSSNFCLWRRIGKNMMRFVPARLQIRFCTLRIDFSAFPTHFPSSGRPLWVDFAKGYPAYAPRLKRGFLTPQVANSKHILTNLMLGA
jgi:hypothetical protein